MIRYPSVTNFKSLGLSQIKPFIRLREIQGKPNGFWHVLSELSKSWYFLACRKEYRQTPILGKTLALVKHCSIFFLRFILQMQRQNIALKNSMRKFPKRIQDSNALQFPHHVLNFFHFNAPVAQLDRASAYEAEGPVFESPRARHSLNVFHSSSG
jgi:hypothetical protein